MRLISNAGFVVMVNGDAIAVTHHVFYRAGITSGDTDSAVIVTGVAYAVVVGVVVVATTAGALLDNGDVIVTRSYARGGEAFTCLSPYHLAELSDSTWTAKASVVRLKN